MLDNSTFSKIMMSKAVVKAGSGSLYPFGNLGSYAASLAISKAILVSLDLKSRYQFSESSTDLIDDYFNIYEKDVNQVIDVLAQHTSVRGCDLRARTKEHFFCTHSKLSANIIIFNDPVSSVLDFFGLGVDTPRKTMEEIYKSKDIINDVLNKSMPICMAIVEHIDK